MKSILPLIELTDYEDGGRILLLPSEVLCIRELAPFSEDGQEEGRRTRIDTSTGMLLVRETVEEILGLCQVAD